jgi:hypothetical protein
MSKEGGGKRKKGRRVGVKNKIRYKKIISTINNNV